MAFEKLEKKISEINEKIKHGKVTKEVETEISNVVKEIEELGGEAKIKFKDTISNLKNTLKKNK